MGCGPLHVWELRCQRKFANCGLCHPDRLSGHSSTVDAEANTGALRAVKGPPLATCHGLPSPVRVHSTYAPLTTPSPVGNDGMLTSAFVRPLP
ncbi:hypothetical protein R1flu_019633 [Riccia fluitans]|uniref:Uncharacterized protein n=1 Tax=Riccia fluitans TaxID=41844 RepID=A0ABD1ZJK2_9MARC